MNIKEELIEKLINNTNAKKSTWRISRSDSFRDYLLDQNKILRVFETEYNNRIILLVEKRYFPEEQYYNNEPNIFEEQIYEIYIIEKNILTVIIHQNEISAKICKELIDTVVVKFTDEYIKKMLE